jgi:rhodanese-related sulfurtransferase
MKIIMIEIKAITPFEAWSILSTDKETALVDVRSESEWKEDGIPDLSSLDKTLQQISWRFYPENIINDNFINFLNENSPNKKIKLLFICRSGVRSLEAAHHAFQSGYIHCFNILNGFDSYKSDNQLGWKQSHLPWRHLK